jgi:phosphoserine phosphatase
MFHESTGEYAGFDGNEPTSKDGGKSAVVQSLIDAHGYNPIVIVGDGVTDLQARPPANVFIGFGGIVERQRVKAESDWFIKDFEELLEILKSPSY